MRFGFLSDTLIPERNRYTEDIGVGAGINENQKLFCLRDNWVVFISSETYTNLTSCLFPYEINLAHSFSRQYHSIDVKFVFKDKTESYHLKRCPKRS